MKKKLKEGDTPLFDLDDKELISFAYRMKNQLVMDTVAPEMMRRLKVSIDLFNKKSSKYSKIIIGLTIVLGVLALIQIVILLQRLFTQA